MTHILTISVIDDGNPTEPVSLEEAKQFLAVDFNDDDQLIESMIKAARIDIEKKTNIALAPKTVTIYAQTTGNTDFISLPYGTTANLEMKSYGEDGSFKDMVLDTDYFIYSNMVKAGSGSYKVTYTAGTTVDESLKEAIKMLVAYRYKNRGDQETQHGFPQDVKDKIVEYTHVWL